MPLIVIVLCWVWIWLRIVKIFWLVVSICFWVLFWKLSLGRMSR